jgi:hypothetical protein
MTATRTPDADPPDPRRLYLREVLRLYLQAPDTPDRAARADWAVAADLYQRKVPLETLAHAIRLASLRRLGNLGTPLPITSLAYFRSVLENLSPDELDPGYVDYVRYRYQPTPGDNCAL